MSLPLTDLAARHCRASKPAVTLSAFVQDHYQIAKPALYRMALGERRASDQFLQRLHAVHTRLFPSDPVDVALPDSRIVHLGPDGLTITFKPSTTPLP